MRPSPAQCHNGRWPLASPPELRPLLAVITLGLGLGLGLGLLAHHHAEAEAPPEICIIAPHLEARPDGSAAGLMLAAQPSLVVVEPLVEVRLLSGPRLLWQRQLPAGETLPRPLPWPLSPLRGEEQLTLLVRPAGQPPGHFAPVQLQAATAAQLADHAALVRRLGSDGQAWLAAIDQQLLGGRVGMAWALLFAPEAPADPALMALRQEAIAQGCGD